MFGLVRFLFGFSQRKKSMGSIELSDFNLCLAKFVVFAEPIKTISSSKTKKTIAF